MTLREKFLTVGMVVLLAAGVSSAALAWDKEDLERLAAAKISLTEAVSIAEKAHQGKAIEAELDDSFGKVVYDVVVVKGDRFYDLRIDAQTGEILRNTEDKD